ncbi:MAG: glycosyltransferase family 2 protein, partial [Burkholderiaceae bacterium]|nr:glycosyltransferase family 2 protein [Microbacteriaceae bacterium]
MTPSRDHLREHIASIVDRGPYSLADTILRLGGVDGPDLLALSASGGREDFGQLMAACESAMAAGTRMPGTYRLRTLGALASMLVGRQLREPRHTTAARLFRYIHEQHGSQGQSKVFGRLMVQTNLAAGEFDFVRRVIAEPAGASEAFDDEIRWMARAELLGPGVLGDDFDAAAWLDVFNEPIIAAGASPVILRDGDGAPFDRLAAGVQQSDAVEHVATDGPLISVVMSVHAPDHSLSTAVHSILAQSWTNLELLVIDDCSPAEFAPVLDKVAGLDPRIRLLRMAENGGTYRIRNRALREARGDLITFQDSDDWSHPERLARQAAPLAEQPGLVATLSASARVSADLSLNAVGYSPTRTNMSSLMFRREPVADRLGGFDTVRKGADSEFFERLVLTYGEPSVLRMPDVMAAVQLTTESLSRGDFSFRWQAPSRVVYREAFQRWHAHIVAGTSSPFLDDIGPRRFPAPYRFLHKGDVPAETTDVLLVSDWRDIAGADGHAAASVRALVGAGLDVSIAHTETLRAATRSRSQTLVEALEMREDGTASWVIWDEPRHARVTVVDDPELMMLRTARGSRLTTD